jgi:hypothetical protein
LITPDLRKKEEKWIKKENHAIVFFTKKCVLYKRNKKFIALKRFEKKFKLL